VTDLLRTPVLEDLEVFLFQIGYGAIAVIGDDDIDGDEQDSNPYGPRRAFLLGLG
jgi:hypothetical protein